MRKTDKKARTVSNQSWTWLAIFILALGLRLMGLDFGLPYLSNFYVRPDETLLVVPAVRFFESRGNPLFFAYPALMMVMLSIFFQAFFLAGRVFNHAVSSDIVSCFIRDMSPFFLIGRVISALAGALIAVLIYHLGRRLSNQKAGLISALYFAVSPLSVRDSHFAVTDILMTFFLVLVIYQVLRYLSRPSSREHGALVAASVIAGLAMATKYMALMLVPLCLAVVILKNGRWPWRKTLPQAFLVGAVSGSVFFIINPYAAVNFMAFLREIIGILKTFYFPKNPPFAWTPLSIWRQILPPLGYGPGGIIGLMFCLAGIYSVLRRRPVSKEKMVLVLGLVLFLLPLIPVRYFIPFRYVIPLFPFIALLTGEGFLAAYRWRSSFLTRGLVLALALSASLFGLFRSVGMDILLTRRDTRTLAGRWISGHVPQDVPVVILGGPECEPQIRESRTSIKRRIDYVNRRYGERSGEIVSEIYRLQLRSWSGNSDDGYEVYRNPKDSKIQGDSVCLVLPNYPLSMANFDPDLKEQFSGKILQRVKFKSLDKEEEDFVLDRIDAFFLPFNKLEKVIHPGPELEVILLSKKRER